jgi:hypothetical protein
MFFIVNHPGAVLAITKYLALFPNDTGHIIRLAQNICMMQLHFCFLLLLFLYYNQFKEYTSYSFRRTGASVLAQRGASNVDIRGYGGWSNDRTPQQ